jgi:hypothetical protein
MSISNASAGENDLGPNPMDAPLCVERSVSGFVHCIDRARQIVERQRALVAKLGEHSPASAALLQNFESMLVLFERSLANHQRANELLAANKNQAAFRSKASVAASIEQSDADRLALRDHEQARALAHIMEILREGGYQFEIRHVSLN